MRIIVNAKTNSKVQKVERVNQQTLDFPGLKFDPVIYKVSVKELPIQGQANDAIVRALAKHFDTAPSNVRLIAGKTSKRKIFEII